MAHFLHTENYTARLKLDCDNFILNFLFKKMVNGFIAHVDSLLRKNIMVLF